MNNQSNHIPTRQGLLFITMILVYHVKKQRRNRQFPYPRSTLIISWKRMSRKTCHGSLSKWISTHCVRVEPHRLGQEGGRSSWRKQTAPIFGRRCPALASEKTKKRMTTCHHLMSSYFYTYFPTPARPAAEAEASSGYIFSCIHARAWEVKLIVYRLKKVRIDRNWTESYHDPILIAKCIHKIMECNPFIIKHWYVG